MSSPCSKAQSKTIPTSSSPRPVPHDDYTETLSAKIKSFEPGVLPWLSKFHRGRLLDVPVLPGTWSFQYRLWAKADSTVHCGFMATIQVVIDDALLERLDRELTGRGKQRSAFVRASIEAALERVQLERDEEEWVASYQRQPVDKRELREWESVQDWGDPWDEPE